MKTTTIWKTDHQFESFQRDGKIEVDAKHGVGPKALLLCGLAGCAGVDVVDILEKMRVPFADLRIDVETEQTEEPPKVFKDIHMTFHVKTGEENREKVNKAIALSLEKYCGVAAMLKKNSSIDYELRISE
jgi:putative redox protein